ncbi:hypothetical protein GOV03_02050 [Candidatus Woesearchaeota archaeon]|nr:hypothetical protein [Candidatus Woesearchaeota archaeon]
MANPKIFVGEREECYSVCIKYDGKEYEETLIPKEFSRLESYVCGLRDGLAGGSAVLMDFPVENGPQVKDVNPLPEKDYQRLFNYICDLWEISQLAMGLSD